MTKQEILDRIETIYSPLGLSGFYASLSQDMKEDSDIVKAFTDRQKVVSRGLMDLRANGA